MTRTSKAASSPSTNSDAFISQLRAQFVARLSAGDLAGYTDELLQEAAVIAFHALRKHQPGQSIVEIETQPGIEHDGRGVTSITIVNDNMPFLFDSVIGEVTESIGEPTFVAHPILGVRRGPEGIEQLGQPDAGDASYRVSLIHIHVRRLSSDEAAALKARIDNVLQQVRIAVHDWKPMLARVQREITRLRHSSAPLSSEAVAETIAFLEWLRDDNFTFLGIREFHYSGENNGTLERSSNPGVGILSDPDVQVLRREGKATTTTPEIRAFLHGPEALIVTKANTKSVVHRRAYLDYIGLKMFDEQGSLAGELRIVGLFTATAYTQSVLEIPYLRSKAKTVIEMSGFSRADHSGKALINVLEAFPRDELFQIDLPLLREHAEAILSLGERPRTRVLYRIDQFDRFVSVIVFVPRDRYTSEVRERIGIYLREVFQGRVSAFYPAFLGPLTRIHFIIGRSEGNTPRIPNAEMERNIRALVRTWDDALSDAVDTMGVDQAIAATAARFPKSYRHSFDAATALSDAEKVNELSATSPILINFYKRPDHGSTEAALKIFHRDAPVALSQRVPVLENMGFRVISEQTFELGELNGHDVFLHDMELETRSGEELDFKGGGTLFEQLFAAVWWGNQDSDSLNALSLAAKLNPQEIAVLRAYSRYLQQVGIAYSQGYIADTLNRYPAIASALYRLFEVRFSFAEAEYNRNLNEERIAAEIQAALEQVSSLDDDTIIRKLLTLIRATLRTNHFAPQGQEHANSIVLKLDSNAIDWLPQPRPWREIFVYGPEVEGVHLRFGPVARGGLRWSDRAQDYRTEVLGLVKAQQVKNGVIVPVGAKGGFYPRRLPKGGNRQEVFEAGRAAYINFISSMLSITDNVEEGGIAAPKGVVRHDGNDAYFVVAADKGTATFSDTANKISQARGFWLDDAFASGGSAGYDHKEMGITARGAWEAVKRHFREMNRNIQEEPFTVVGVGDMSGDVFGNGMQLSPHIRLVAAFDHRDIFIDPDPDAAASLAERRRLFNLLRSSWQDYDKSKLSKGGMIVSRSEKQVALSLEAAAAIGLDRTVVSPVEIMSAILRAPVDLLWFGGIGTYVRSSAESNLDVGDRANDAIRVVGKEVRAKVIGEGANLGMTQRARIEFNQSGGRCNSDAIDNSAGVNSSDVEVNIKIALASAMQAGRLDRPSRDRLLAEMTDEVSQLVLANNYQQPLAVSLMERRGRSELPHLSRMITLFERRGVLDRTVEHLPGPEALAEKQARGETLTRAELGVLLAYAKIVHFDELIASKLPDCPYFDKELFGYFPEAMRETFAEEIRSHRLHREIIATVLINDLVNRGGAAFITQLQDMTGCPTSEIAEAYTVVRDGFDLEELYSSIDDLDNRIDGQLQLSLYERIRRLIVNGTAWQLKNGSSDVPIGERIEKLREAVIHLMPVLKDMQPQFLRDRINAVSSAIEEANVPAEIARKLGLLDAFALMPDIMLIATAAKCELTRAAEAYFAISEEFRLERIESAIEAIMPTDYYDGLALVRALDMIDAARRSISVTALTAHRGEENAATKWLEEGSEQVRRVVDRLTSITDGGDITVSRLTVAAGLMTDVSG